MATMTITSEKGSFLQGGDREHELKDGKSKTEDSLDRLQKASSAYQSNPENTLSILIATWPRHVCDGCRGLCYAFVPQLLRSTIWKDRLKPSKQFSTSYLNGLRGICAVKVYTFHFMYAYSRATSRPYGSGKNFYYFLELPIIRWCFAGSTSHVFFGVAGYLMSVRLFQLMDKRDQASQSKIYVSVSTSLFRRIFRLYLPLACMMFLTSILIYLGVFEYTRSYTQHPHRKQYFAGGRGETLEPQMPTLYAQLTLWWRDFFELTDIWNTKPVYSRLDPHLWSLPYEFRASLHLYACVILLGQCRKHVRLILLLALVGVYFVWNRWELTIFLLGAAVAQMDVILPPVQSEQEQVLVLPKSDPLDDHRFVMNDPPHPLLPSRLPWVLLLPTSRNRRYLLARKKTIRTCAFLLAFFLLSYPLCCQEVAPGYQLLNRLIPQWMERKDKFYSNIGTTILLFLLCRSDPTSSRWLHFLNSPIPQYLGTLSFSIYLVHGPVLNIIGFMLPHFVWWGMGIPLTPATNPAWAIGIGLGWAGGLGLVLWAADVWAREVEGRCVQLVKRLEGVCFAR